MRNWAVPEAAALALEAGAEIATENANEKASATTAGQNLPFRAKRWLAVNIGRIRSKMVAMRNPRDRLGQGRLPVAGLSQMARHRDQDEDDHL